VAVPAFRKYFLSGHVRSPLLLRAGFVGMSRHGTARTDNANGLFLEQDFAIPGHDSLDRRLRLGMNEIQRLWLRR
jgi:hypothetical protein